MDRETGVNYLWHSTGHAGGMTPLLDREGSPSLPPFGGEGVICMKLLFVNGCISQRGRNPAPWCWRDRFWTHGRPGIRRPRWRLWNQRPRWALKPLCAGDAERPGRPGGDPVLRCAGV
ncbi:MAG: DUF6440 family protein [Oscillibacter sp.]